MERIQTIVAGDVGDAKRAVHAKAHGLLVGELEVLPNLPPVLAHGLFARVRQAVYAAAARFRVDYNHRSLVEPRSAADLPA
jgi:hypothetical protein